MDVHVPTAVNEGLRRRGVDVMTAQEVGNQESADEALLTRATEVHRILFTQDDDLLVIASAWQKQGREFAGLVYCHQLAAGIGRIIEDLELLALCTTDDEVRNHVLYLPL